MSLIARERILGPQRLSTPAAQPLADYGTWRVPNRSLVVEYHLETIEKLCRDAESAPPGRVFNGLLVGTHSSDRIQITSFESVPPAAVPAGDSSLHQHSLAALANHVALPNRPQNIPSPVGWFRTHFRADFSVRTEDTQLFEEFSSGSWVIALLLLPHPGGVEARLILPDRDAPTQLVRYPAPADAVEKPSTPVAEAIPAPARSHRTRIGIVAALFLLAAGIGLFVWLSRASILSRPSVVLSLEAASLGGIIELRWNPQTLGAVETGRLEIRDGSLARQVPLTAAEASSGRYSYRPATDITAFRLHLEGRGHIAEGSATYVARKLPDRPPQAKPALEAGPPAELRRDTTELHTPLRIPGHWALASREASRSPVQPESLRVSILESRGALRGTLEGFYRSRRSTVRVHFSFTGTAIDGAARCFWNGTDGRRGRLDFTPVPHSPDRMRVVWQNPESKQVFSELLRRER